MKMACFLEPKEEASQRTKNRIKEHGPIFMLIKQERVPCFSNEEGLLVESDDGWWGWLPSSEMQGTIVDD